MVKRVVIPKTCDLKLSVVFETWIHLEEIISRAVIHNEVFAEIGRNKGHCSYSNYNLTSLHLRNVHAQHSSFTLTAYNSYHIAKHLQELKVLSIQNYDVQRDGVSLILRECKNLSRLSIEHCGKVSYRGCGRLYDSGKRMYGKIEKQIEDGNVKWSINSMERLCSLEEVLDHLFGSI